MAPIKGAGLDMTLAPAAASRFMAASRLAATAASRSSSLVGHDEFDAVEIEGAHRSARPAAQGHVDQHAIFDSARQRTDRIESA
jgi:hypothetical protein